MSRHHDGALKPAGQPGELQATEFVPDLRCEFTAERSVQAHQPKQSSNAKAQARTLVPPAALVLGPAELNESGLRSAIDGLNQVSRSHPSKRGGVSLGPRRAPPLTQVHDALCSGKRSVLEGIGLRVRAGLRARTKGAEESYSIIHCTTVKDMVTNIRKDILDRAEAKFKKTQLALKEGAKARAEYEARALTIRANTARLRSLRLARDAAKR